MLGVGTWMSGYEERTKTRGVGGRNEGSWNVSSSEARRLGADSGCQALFGPEELTKHVVASVADAFFNLNAALMIISLAPSGYAVLLGDTQPLPTSISRN
ncbi:hypothetical protein CVT26_007740 [Gymnopilus dilepis]|uniref:Uncharacterized protein n=1 Tax=Gymnopilus dilepis TaxID=231916 RepID=A0A409WLG1_9AGAR|nr:hypothetical protein CVT26_007740 [Gymnopilus dilepis]